MVLAVLGCASDREPTTPAPPATVPEPVAPEAPVGADVVHHVERVALPEEGRTWSMHRFEVPLSRARLSVLDMEFDGELVEALEREGASIVINGGFWNPARAPEGLTIVDDEERVPFEPDLGGGVIVVRDGRARVLDAEAEGFDAPTSATFAQQCKPRLVVDGAVNIAPNDRTRADRSALCVRDGGRTLEVVVARTGDDRRARGGPSLRALAEALAAAGCEQALNLDGGPSSGVAWRARDGFHTLPTRTPVRLAIAVHLR